MGTEEDARKLFVAGLPDTVTDDGLRALFTSTGSRIDELSLPRDRTTGRPRGFAFVTLSSAEEAQRARDQLDGSLMEGRSISVRPFSSGPPRGPGERPAFGGGGGGFGGGGGGFSGGGGGFGGGGGGFSGGGGGFAGGAERRPAPPRDDSNRTLYVGNLPYDMEEVDLRGLFTQMGAKDLDRVHLPMDHATGRKRGFAFVSFTSEDAAKAALEVLGNLNVRGRQCTVHLAHPRGERPAPRGDRPFGAGPGGPGGPGGPPGFRSSPPPSGVGGPRRAPSFGPPSFGSGPGGRPPVRRTSDEEGAARTAKGVSRKKRLEEEKKRGGGNARRYMDDIEDDD
jgi:nucleolin